MPSREKDVFNRDKSGWQKKSIANQARATYALSETIKARYFGLLGAIGGLSQSSY